MNEKEFKELVGFAVEEIVAEKSKKGFIERLVGITAFVAALGAFAGSAIAINSALDTLSKQEKIESTQRHIERRQIVLNTNQKRLDENSRISRISNSIGKHCSPIPLDENDIWENYLQCLKDDGVTKSKSNDTKRLACISKYGACST